MSESSNGYACEAGAQDFTATAYRDSKGQRWVTVTGTCSCQTSGYKLKLALASPLLVPVPEELHVNLTEDEPNGPVLDVITPTEVESKFKISDEVERVVFRNRNFSVEIKKE
ncbi:hypothetical protein EJ357_41320 [Streptomyces cyaneochromogenes]|uniref:Uncharacterized protein n=1 Tax=Streptomyces cyaneochromogenes TaxID=2496836 RepID=A0A3S9MIY3_9ACTN|nr:hypothetical protein [Streptomyces cyaneochromogenes]AZQ39085.1 hypothetical protein EJ357_41320 [Streptomyces cyaneochromogenes]